MTFRGQEGLNTQNSGRNSVEVSSAQVLPPVHDSVAVRGQCPGAGKKQSPFNWLGVEEVSPEAVDKSVVYS